MREFQLKCFSFAIKQRYLSRRRPNQLQSDEEALERAQHQIFLISQAMEFQKDKNNNNDANGGSHAPLLGSIMNGTETRSTFHSPSSRQIIGHTSTCKNTKMCSKNQAENIGCSHCSKQQQHVQGSVNADALVICSPNALSNVADSTDWRHSVGRELRNHLIDKQVEAIHSDVYQNTLCVESKHILYACAKRFEENAFEKANSKHDYYYLWANEMYDIRNDLKKTRPKRKFAQMAQNQCDMTASSAPTDDSNNFVDLTMERTFCDMQEQVSEKISFLGKISNESC